MIEHLILTAVQARILLSLLLDGSLTSSNIMSKTSISGTAWRREKQLLSDLELIRSEHKVLFAKTGVQRGRYHSLTERGTLVAKNLQAISQILKKDSS